MGSFGRSIHYSEASHCGVIVILVLLCYYIVMCCIIKGNQGSQSCESYLAFLLCYIAALSTRACLHLSSNISVENDPNVSTTSSVICCASQLSCLMNITSKIGIDEMIKCFDLETSPTQLFLEDHWFTAPLHVSFGLVLLALASVFVPLC